MRQETTMIWLKAGAGLTVFFGVLIAAASIPAAAGPVEYLADLIFFPLDGGQNVGAPETRLMGAIGGGVMAGWGVMIWMMATRLYPREPELTKRMIVAGLLVWYAIDSTGSVLSGAPLNAVFNLGFLLIFFIPLWRAGRATATVGA